MYLFPSLLYLLLGPDLDFLLPRVVVSLHQLEFARAHLKSVMPLVLHIGCQRSKEGK